MDPVYCDLNASAFPPTWLQLIPLRHYIVRGYYNFSLNQVGNCVTPVSVAVTLPSAAKPWAGIARVA